jgi:hypothetical protein
MKAEELRIGNYLKDFGGNVGKVIHVTKDKVILESPIHLNKEWIEKFDWFSVDEDRYTFRDIEYYSISEEGSLYFNGHYTCTEIKYVHQLQNLYFALTGWELLLKP